MSLILVEVHGTIGPNNCDTTGLSQFKVLKLCAKTVSFRVIFAHFVDRSLLAVHQTIFLLIPARLSYERSEKKMVPNDWKDKRRNSLVSFYAAGSSMT